MRRLSFQCCCVVCLVALTSSLSADVRSDQRVKFQLGGALGKMVNMFGGKGAREGVTTIVAVKGNRKATMTATRPDRSSTWPKRRSTTSTSRRRPTR